MMGSVSTLLFCRHPALLAAPYKLWLLWFWQSFYPSASHGPKYNSLFCTRCVSRPKNVIRVMNWTCLMWKGAFQTLHFPLKATMLQGCPSSRPFLEYIAEEKHCFDSYKILKQITDFSELIASLISTKLVIFYFSWFLCFSSYIEVIVISWTTCFTCRYLNTLG